MGRTTSGVIGTKFKGDDELLSMLAIDESKNSSYVVVATDGGYAKRTPIEEYRPQGRGGIGIKAAKLDEGSRGSLIGALIVEEKDEILAISSEGTVMRTPASEIRQTGRDTLGVRLVNLGEGNSLISLALVREDDVVAEIQDLSPSEAIEDSDTNTDIVSMESVEDSEE
jgi:DNA gyrase subunit A